MRLNDIFTAVEQRWGQGYQFQAAEQKKRIAETVREFGEGFAVFVGGRLLSFSGEVGWARNSARKAVGDGAERSTVSIKRVSV